MEHETDRRFGRIGILITFVAISLIASGVTGMVLSLSVIARGIEDGSLFGRGRRRVCNEASTAWRITASCAGFGRVGRSVAGENIFIMMVTLSVASEVWIVARAEQEESIERLQAAGASRVFSPSVTAGREMSHSAIDPRVVDFIEVEAARAPAMCLGE